MPGSKINDGQNLGQWPVNAKSSVDDVKFLNESWDVDDVPG